jgi:uncharacterized protein (TIGR02145 family)
MKHIFKIILSLTIFLLLFLLSCQSKEEKEKQENEVYEKFTAFINNISDSLTTSKSKLDDLVELRTEIKDPRDNQTYAAIKLKGINKLWITDQLNYKDNSSNETLEKSNSSQKIKFVPGIDYNFKKLGITAGCYYNERYLNDFIPKGCRILNKNDLEELNKFFQEHNLNNSSLFVSASSMKYGNTIISYSSMGKNELDLNLLPISPLFVFGAGSGSDCIDERSTNSSNSIVIPLSDYKENEVVNHEKKAIVRELANAGDYEGAKSINDNVANTYVQNVRQVALIKVFDKREIFNATFNNQKLSTLIEKYLKDNNYDSELKDKILQKYFDKNRGLTGNELRSSGLTYSVEDKRETGGQTNFFYPIRLVKDL